MGQQRPGVVEVAGWLGRASLATVVVWVCAGVAPPPAAPSVKGPTRVLVMPFKVKGVSDWAAQEATDMVAQAFLAREGYAVLTVADVQKLVSAEALRTMVGCDSQECVAQVSRALDADLLVIGSMGSVGNRTTVQLSLIEPRQARSVNAVSGELRDPRAVVKEMTLMVGQLMGWAGLPERRFKLPAGSKTSLAVLDLGARGVSDDVAANLTQVLSAELKRIEGTTVVSREDIAAMMQLQETKLRVGCDDMECLAEIGGALGVDRIVAGSVGKLAQSYVVSLRLISARASRVENLVTESYSGAEDQLIRAVKRAGRKLLGLESDGVGALSVTASEQGAQVLVDGVARGTLPMPPVKGLAPGLHGVMLLKGGFHDWSSDVYVDSDETTVVWADLVARPVRWYRQWWVWALAGGASTVLATSAILVVGTLLTASLVVGWVVAQNSTRTTVTIR
jgi:TolB-like protein